MASRSITILGKVQGVGYRAYTQQIAEELGIQGEVWNRRDGAVEIVAIHEDESALAELIRRLWRGPGQVDELVIIPGQDLAPSGRFRVSPTR